MEKARADPPERIASYTVYLSPCLQDGWFCSERPVLKGIAVVCCAAEHNTGRWSATACRVGGPTSPHPVEDLPQHLGGGPVWGDGAAEADRGVATIALLHAHQGRPGPRLRLQVPGAGSEHTDAAMGYDLAILLRNQVWGSRQEATAPLLRRESATSEAVPENCAGTLPSIDGRVLEPCTKWPSAAPSGGSQSKCEGKAVDPKSALVQVVMNGDISIQEHTDTLPQYSQHLQPVRFWNVSQCVSCSRIFGTQDWIQVCMWQQCGWCCLGGSTCRRWPGHCQEPHQAALQQPVAFGAFSSRKRHPVVVPAHAHCRKTE